MARASRLLLALILCVTLTGCPYYGDWIKGGGKYAYIIEIYARPPQDSELQMAASSVRMVLLDHGCKDLAKSFTAPDSEGQMGSTSYFAKILGKEPLAIDARIGIYEADPKRPPKLHIWVGNLVVGNTDPLVTHEIDQVGDAVYEKLVQQVGKEKTTLVRRSGTLN